MALLADQGVVSGMLGFTPSVKCAGSQMHSAAKGSTQVGSAIPTTYFESGFTSSLRSLDSALRFRVLYSELPVQTVNQFWG